MSASLADSAGRLPACRIRFERAGSPPAKSGWQPDIPFFQLRLTAEALE
jgi:hypothetical protein